MTSSIAVTPRGRQRSERILDATATLVAERGFHAVGIADIGAAAGVSGSAIYRHFRSKQEILAALLDRAVDELLAGAGAALEETDDARGVIDALVRRHVAFALRDRAIIAVYSQEAKHLPGDDLHRLRRNQRAYAEIWARQVAQLRTDLSSDEALTAVHAAFGLLNSVANFRSRLGDDDLARLLHVMTMQCLDLPG